MRVYYSDTFDLALPEGHRFPGQKYGMLRKRLIEDEILQEQELFCSPLATTEDIERAHDRGYIDAIDTGSIDASAMRRIGFPWSPHIARRARATAGGAIAAAKASLDEGISGQLAGGTHHAHPSFGAGYCIFNDQAVAALHLLNLGVVERVAVIDLDVHQGDGTAAILGPNASAFVLSVHGEKNFPFRKIAADLDVGLPDMTGDDEYLAAVEQALPAVFSFTPDIVFFQAGVDPLKEDKLGRMALTHKGLMARDELILGACKARGIPVSMAIGGGYADPIEASVEAYANTYRVAKRLFAT